MTQQCSLLLFEKRSRLTCHPRAPSFRRNLVPPHLPGPTQKIPRLGSFSSLVMSSPDPSASPAPGPVQLARSLRLLRSDASSSVRFLRAEFGGLTGKLAAFRLLGRQPGEADGGRDGGRQQRERVGLRRYDERRESVGALIEEYKQDPEIGPRTSASYIRRQADAARAGVAGEAG